MAIAINGTQMLVYIDGTAVALSKTCKVSFLMNTSDTTTKDDDWKNSTGGQRSWKVDGDGLVAFDSAYNFSELFTLIKNRTKVILRFECLATYYAQGYAFLTDLKEDSPENESVSMSFGFEGVSALIEVFIGWILSMYGWSDSDTWLDTAKWIEY